MFSLGKVLCFSILDVAVPADCREVAANTYVEIGQKCMKYHPNDGSLTVAAADDTVPLFPHAYMNPEDQEKSPIFQTSNMTDGTISGFLLEDLNNARLAASI